LVEAIELINCSDEVFLDYDPAVWKEEVNEPIWARSLLLRSLKNNSFELFLSEGMIQVTQIFGVPL
jgi:hypothetical protein